MSPHVIPFFVYNIYGDNLKHLHKMLAWLLLTSIIWPYSFIITDAKWIQNCRYVYIAQHAASTSSVKWKKKKINKLKCAEMFVVEHRHITYFVIWAVKRRSQSIPKLTSMGLKYSMRVFISEENFWWNFIKLVKLIADKFSLIVYTTTGEILANLYKTLSVIATFLVQEKFVQFSKV